MKVTDLFNYKKEDYETNETFAKRVYETAKRVSGSLNLNLNESWIVLQRLAKYYDESSMNIISAIRDIELCNPSKKYRIQWVQCLGDHYLVIDKRQV